MEKYVGKSVSGGVAMGKIKLLDNNNQAPPRYMVDDENAELIRMHNAIEEAKKQLDSIYDKVMNEVGQAGAGIFEIHRMLLEDEDYIEAAEEIIKTERVNAEYAVFTTGKNFAKMFSDMNDDYMKHRALDIIDASRRVISVLGNNLSDVEEPEEPAIIVAEDLSPQQTMTMEKSKILAIVTKYGSVNSHTSILAGMMNIPAIVGVDMDLEKIREKIMAVVDGYNGEFIVEPDEDYIRAAMEKISREREDKRLLQDLRGKDNVTRDGRKINVYANISSFADVSVVKENDAGGIGLFRSEFLYMGRDTFPSEEEQFSVYSQVLKAMEGRKVIIRTLDVGADKQLDYMNQGTEQNPALGYRAIRFCLTEPEIFKVQLRALLRAGTFGNLSIMYPMITSEWEIDSIMEIVEEAKRELSAEGKSYDVKEQGIMIETPAAALISDKLAKKVDFFSIGTNDLIQYTLAIDRQNQKLEKFFNPRHEAVLRLISTVIDNAHKNNIWAGICGELAADLTLTKKFLAMGADELSVSPGMVLKLRKIIRQISLL